MSSQTFRKEEIPWEEESYFQQHDGQLALFQPEFIRDADCTKDTPVIHGRPDSPIYGTGKRIRPRVPGRRDSEYMKKILLEELLPLEEYDRVILLISGGKDSIASYYKLLELGIPKQKIEFWHHDIDGGNPTRVWTGAVHPIISMRFPKQSRFRSGCPGERTASLGNYTESEHPSRSSGRNRRRARSSDVRCQRNT